MSAYRPDYLFQAPISFRGSYPSKSHVSKDWRRSQAGMSQLDDIDSSTRGFYAILSRDLVTHERSLSFTYGRPAESLISLRQMYFGKRRASQINLFSIH